MGSSSSKSNINITNNIITQTSVDLMNQQVNKAVAETVIKHASKCSASAAQIASINRGDIVAKGKGSKVKWTSGIVQVASVNMKCIQQSIQDNSVGQSMGVEIFNQISQRTNAEQLNKMTAMAQGSLSQGVAGGLLNPFSNVDVSVNQKLSNTQLTQTQLKLANIVNNEVTNKVSLSDLKECVASQLQQATMKGGNIIATEGGEIEGQDNIQQTVDLIANCQQLTSQVSQVTQGILAKMGVQVDQSSTGKQSSEASATSIAKMEQRGLDDLVTSFGNLLSGLFFGLLSPYMASAAFICIIVCCCISSCALSLMAGAAGGEDEM